MRRLRLLAPLGAGLILLSPIAGGAWTPNPTPWTETVLHAFDGADGAGPTGLIEDASGALYGTAGGGGLNGQGTVFKLTPPTRGEIAWTESVLYSFTGGTGAHPLGNCQGGWYQ
jgi:uncharacterized repeat protein (TIGR03803 family)